MNRLKTLLIILVSGFIGYQIHKADLFPIGDFIDRQFAEEISETQLKYSVVSNLKGKHEVVCPSPEDTLVFGVFGQSNSANNGGHKFENSDPKILNFFNGKCYIAEDPLLGASGGRGSLWIPFAKKLKTNKHILFASFGVNSSTIKDWLSEDHLWAHYKDSMSRLVEKKYTPDFFIWIQGESDSETVIGEYSSDLDSFLKKVQSDFPESKVAVSGTSYCHGVTKEIVMTQKAIANDNGYLWLGNTDKFHQPRYRFDNCHLSEQGLQAFADMFSEIINKYLD